MDTKKILSAEDILAAEDLEIIEVPCPEWGGVIKIRALSAQEAIEYAESTKDALRKKNGNALLVLKCAMKDDGTPMFTAQDLDKLSKKSLKVINRIANAAIELNGLGSVEQNKTKDTEAKNG